MKHSIEIKIETQKGLFKMPDKVSQRFDVESNEHAYVLMGHITKWMSDNIGR